MTRPTLAGSNAPLVKAHNLRAILLHLLQSGQASRAQLADQTALSNAAITNLVYELLEQGILTEEGAETQADGQRRVGRPRTTLRLVPEARFALGIHIGIGTLRVAVTNLHAEIVHNLIADYEVRAPATDVLEQAAQLVERTLRESGVKRSRLCGLGIGASGHVNPDTGVNTWAPALGWRDVPVRDWMKARLRLPVTVDNNVRAMALGEAMFGAGRGVNLLAFVYGRIGVGAGFVLNGQLFRGSGAGAGEVGHTIMLPDGGELCGCGKRGCLETLVSEPVFIRQAEALAARSPQSMLARHLRQRSEARPIERIFAAARAGDTATRDMITERARYLGIALANLVNVLNPELILLGGMFAQGSDLILPTAEATMRATAFAGLGERVRVLPTEYGWRAGVIGAAALALDTFFYRQMELNG
jgi:glucokinase-like ROK family protein